MKVRLSMLAALCAVLFSGVPSALADDPGATATNAVHYYVSLGDSLASAPEKGGDANNYVDQLFVELKQEDPTLQLVKLACGGETTGSMILRNPCSYSHGSQLNEAVSFLHAHRQFVSLVTLDIGGNDVLLCVFHQDQGCLDSVLPSVASNLATIVLRLREAAGPEIPVVGMNYYDPFLAFWFSSPTAAQITEEMAVQFNDVLGSAYSTAGDPVADVETAFSTTDWTLVDGVPLNVLRICQWTRMCMSSPDVHPNTAGYGVIADAFEQVLP
jgi:lysophospholipase L1-like esterase